MMGIATHFSAWLGDIAYRRVGWSFHLKPTVDFLPGATEIGWLWMQFFLPPLARMKRRA